jgi:hypothetical protein
MTSNKSIRHPLTWAVSLAVLVFAALPALAQKGDTPSSLLTFKTARQTPGDGYMVAGDLWDTIKPMNSEEGNGVEDPLRNDNLLHFLTIGPDGSNWHDPTCFWPGGYHITNCWRDGRRLTFPIFEADGWPGYTTGNRIFDASSGGEDERMMFAYYGPDLPGAGDPARDYKSAARFTDETRTHMIYEAGWPTTAGIDFRIRAHQYTVNDQNLNDFVVLEITMENTGVVDTDADGTPEATDHAIDAAAAYIEGLPTPAVRVLNTGVRNANVFGAGRTMGYWATPDENGHPVDLFAWYANTPPGQTTGRSVPEAGMRSFGINNGRFNEGYTDVWNSWKFMGVKQGDYSDGLASDSPDKETLFGTHPVGEGAQRGWYTSNIWQSSLAGWNRPDLGFRTATATWYADYGKTTTSDTRDLNPNPNFFSGGTPDDVTTFVVGDASARPNGDYKYATLDLDQTRMEQPVWEPALNPGAADGSDFYGGVGWNLEYVFSQALVSGIGPFSLAVGEEMTIVFAVTAGYRATGILDSYDAANWAWERGWDISADLPVPPAPDMKPVSTTAGTAKINWTDVSSIGPVDGYKIWRAAQFNVQEYLDTGFRALDGYQRQHSVDEDPNSFLEPINPNFDWPEVFIGETQGIYNPAEWGTYDLILKIPNGDLSQYQSDVEAGYDYAWIDEEAITGFTYWYYVSAYRDGSYTGPQGSVGSHLESSNWNRNGRNSPAATDGEIGLVTPWGGTYPFADRNADFPDTQQGLKNIGAPFTVTPPVAPIDSVASLITVTPNPYKITGLNDVRNDPSSHSIDFLNLPSNYILTIVDVSGQIIQQVAVTGAVDGKYTWDMFSKDGTEVGSGLYIYHVQYGADVCTLPEPSQCEFPSQVTGHFAIMR